jgi:hypothetical protein
MASTWRMRMVLFSIAISCSSARPATGVLTPTRRAALVDCTCMKAPEAFWFGTVARTQGAVTVTWASALVESRPAASRANRGRVMVIGFYQ